MPFLGAEVGGEIRAKLWFGVSLTFIQRESLVSNGFYFVVVWDIHPIERIKTNTANKNISSNVYLHGRA